MNEISAFKISCPLDDRILRWEYECLKCRGKFEVEVPRGPKEEKAINCPVCKSKDIHRINVPDLLHTECGG